ncbi:MAG: hypothetical protein AAFY29_20045 [Pseudomonadota bacterium]
MKTGSTAFQRAVEYAKPKLIQHGCLPTFVPSDNALLQRGGLRSQKKIINRLLKEASSLNCTTLLFSSEHLSAIHETSTLEWLGLLAKTGATIEAVLVRRPLRELYPSLYLQNLKGRRQRVSTFSDFVKEQLEVDETLCWTRNCTSFNYPCLRKRLKDAGAEVEELQYTRESLITELFARALPDAAIRTEDLIPPKQWVANWRAQISDQGKMDASRSLSWNLVPVAIEINKLARQQVLNGNQRNRLLMTLLDVSSPKTQLPESDHHLLGSIDALDSKINGMVTH